MSNGNPGSDVGESFSSKSRTQRDPLALICVFDRLEVGPPLVEGKRVVAPYRLVYNGKEELFNLIYHYEEEVFDPSEAISVNVASVIVAQVALNYGLFCRSIVFHGIFDEVDRRFIRHMAENTAREIFVKKLLQPNPFLIGEAAHLAPLKRRRYLLADVEFPDTLPDTVKTPGQLWQTSRHRHAILSSGGKDSLLSFGLIDEIGGEIHPIFVNESGRHWFTALNAHRYFSENIPNTARVWVNSDRLFAWMLRRMPFIRQDFATIRSDEYPIRLWTLAVFLFGAVPLIRKRGIGRVLIGDEFDTSRRSSYKGVTHYDGLYDQSRYFDNALSRYYMRKGWSISQCSVVRPLSEMLIEKILYERYPNLHEQQLSCHAAHIDGERVRPCGKCEKCRRIVGMSMAIDADPTRCGYTEEQIQTCLQDLLTKEVHQESAGVQQLIFMLTKRGLLEESPSMRNKSREHPHVLKLRFDPERSPIDGIPTDLREPIYRICLEHAEGAVARVGRSWGDVDPLKDPAIGRPYPFESESNTVSKGAERKEKTTELKSYLWGNLSWPEAEQRLREVDVALLPVGSIEQHGPHLPLSTDAYDADYLARQVARSCSVPKPLVLPLIPYGVSYHHDDFKGTISISNDTLSRLAYEIGMNAARNGINKLVIINAHGGNSPALNYAAQRINCDARIFVCVDTGETSDVDIDELAETPNDVHAGEIETSTSLAVRPHLVNLDEATKLVPEFSSRYLNFTSKRSVSWYAYTKRISPTGVMGDPTKASVEKGRKMWRIMIAHLVALVEDLKSMTLEEIYQRRY